MLKAFNVTKQFGSLTAVDDLSFEVKKGQIFGTAGPNGTGKSTLYNLITGFYSFEGRIELDGQNISGMPPYRIAKTCIARTFRFRKPFPASVYKKASPWAAGLVPPAVLTRPMWMRASVSSILNKNVYKIPTF